MVRCVLNEQASLSLSTLWVSTMVCMPPPRKMQTSARAYLNKGRVMQTSGRYPARRAPNRVHFFAASSSNDRPFTPTPPCIYFSRPPSPTISLEYLYYHIIWVVLPGAARERSAIVHVLPGRASAAPKKRVRQGLAGNFTGPTVLPHYRGWSAATPTI